MDYTEINKRALKKFRPAMLPILEGAPDVEEDEFVIEKAQNGELTCEINSHCIYSTYNPRMQILRYVNGKNQEVRSKGVIFVLGFALGYLIEEIMPRLKEKQVIVVIDKDYRYFKASISFKDYTDIIRSKKVEFITKFDDDTFMASLERYRQLIEFKGMTILRLEALYDKDRDFYKHIESKILEYARTLSVAILTNMYQVNKFTANALSNIPHYVRGTPINEFKDKFYDIPAIVVSGGPSLNKNIDQIKEAEGKAVIIALGTTLKPLLSHGIHPDFVVAIDPSNPQIKYFAGVKPPPDTPLLTSNEFYRKILDEYWHNPVVVTRVPDKFSNFLDETVGRDVDPIPFGMTVAHTAFNFADYIGANPIIVVGQDLGFPMDAQFDHVDGAATARKVQIKEGDARYIWIEDIYGKPLPTHRNMVAYKVLFENYISQIKLRDKGKRDRIFVDATEGGAKIEGTKIMTFKEALDRYMKEEHSIRESIISTLERSEEPDYVKLIDVLNDRINEFILITEYCTSILKALDELTPDDWNVPKKLQKLNMKITQFDKKMGEMKAFSFLERYMVIFNELKIKRDLLSKKQWEKRKELEIQLNKSSQYYSGIRTVAKFYETGIKYVINKKLLPLIKDKQIGEDG